MCVCVWLSAHSRWTCLCALSARHLFFRSFCFFFILFWFPLVRYCFVCARFGGPGIICWSQNRILTTHNEHKRHQYALVYAVVIFFFVLRCSCRHRPQMHINKLHPHSHTHTGPCTQFNKIATTIFFVSSSECCAYLLCVLNSIELKEIVNKWNKIKTVLFLVLLVRQWQNSHLLCFFFSSFVLVDVISRIINSCMAFFWISSCSRIQDIFPSSVLTFPLA